MNFQETKRYTPPEKGRGSKLTHKMISFIDEYMVDMRAVEAVKRSAYNTKNPKQLSCELLAHPLVIAEIDRRMEKKRDRNELTEKYVLHELMEIVENTKQGNPTAALRGLELLGKNLGLFRERQEISGPDGEAIQMEQKTAQNAEDFTSRISRLAVVRGTGGTPLDSDGSREE